MICLFRSIFVYISWQADTEYTSHVQFGSSLKTVHIKAIHPFRIFKAAQKLKSPYLFFIFFRRGTGGEGTKGKNGYIPRAGGADKLMDSCTYLIQRNLDITNALV